MTTELKDYLYKRANQDKFVEEANELIAAASTIVDWLESGHMTPIYEEDVERFIKLYRAIGKNTIVSI